jgi:hypothetical protein
MRYVRTLQTVAAMAAVVSFTGVTSANDPCPTCANGVSATLLPKPKCDNQIYPLSEYHYYKRYCGPVISPNATYGHFQTKWRPWDGGTNPNGYATSTETVTAVAPTAPSTVEIPKTPATESTAPKVMPPAVNNKEAIPAPKLKDKGARIDQRFAPGSPVSPGVYLVPVNAGR